MPTAARTGLPPTFEAHTISALRELRAALADLLGLLPGPLLRPAQLSGLLGIDAKLSWSIFQVVRATDLLHAAQYVPRAAGFRKLLRAAGTLGVAPTALERVVRRAEEFERVVALHAGDRATFDLMISGRAANGADQIEVAFRRDAFRANSHIWGVQARVKLVAHVFHPGSRKDMLHAATIRGMFGLRRIRPNVPWVIDWTRMCNDDGALRRVPGRLPLERARGGLGRERDMVPLLTPFCTKPLPKLRRVARPDGTVEHEWMPGPVGNTAAITCVMGDVAYDVLPRFRDARNQFASFSASVRMPCELLILDLLVHEEVFGPMTPELVIYGDLHGGPEYPSWVRQRPQLPVTEPVQYLGKGAEVLANADVPRNPELARYVFESLAWDEQRFDVYRVRVPYPVVPSTVMLRHALPARPRPAGRSG